MKLKKRLKRRPQIKSEASLQINICEWLKDNLSEDVEWTHFPAGGGGYRRGALLKRMGLKRGWPDLIFLSQGRFYGIELKRPGGKLSVAQRDRHRRLLSQGMSVVTCWDLPGVQTAVVSWSLHAE